MTKTSGTLTKSVSRKSIAFGHAAGRFSIGSLNNNTLTVEAQFNPKELQVERTVNWKQQDLRDNRPEWLRARTGRDGLNDDMEYTGSETRTMTFELLLDGFEEHRSIEPEVRALEEMACVREPDSREDALRRPHHCVVVFGHRAEGMGKLRCVITKLSVKYSMFTSAGVPVRASVNLTVKEAFNLQGFGNKLDKDAKKRADAYEAEAKARQKPSWGR